MGTTYKVNAKTTLTKQWAKQNPGKEGTLLPATIVYSKGKTLTIDFPHTSPEKRIFLFQTFTITKHAGTSQSWGVLRGLRPVDGKNYETVFVTPRKAKSLAVKNLVAAVRKEA